MSAEKGMPIRVPNRGTPMGVAVMGLMRTGTTLVCDLLTLRGRSLVVSEPNLLALWDGPLQLKMNRLYREFGLDVPSLPPREGEYRSNIEYFDQTILPQLKSLELWGVKCVDLFGWQRLLRIYPPKRLVLCVRDLRAVTISALELVNRMGLVFTDTKRMRDEAWIFSRIAYSVQEMMAMRAVPHMVLRYEDLVAEPAARDRLAAYCGLDRLGEERLNLVIERETRSGWELAKHGKEITTKALDRYDEEPEGPMRTMADRIWRMFPEYSLAFGYEVPAPRFRIRRHDFCIGPDPGINPIKFKETEVWNWRGPKQLEPVFGRRRARTIVALNLKPGAVLLDLGCGTAAMRKMLAKSSSHLPADVAVRAPLFVVSDIYRGELPPGGEATHVAALGVLEYVEDLPGFLNGLRGYNVPVFVSYYATDDTPKVDRVSLGWKNGYRRNELMRMFIAAGFMPTPKWAFDGQQSLFRLIPRQIMARKRRRPRAKIILQGGPRPGPGKKPAPKPKGKSKKELEPV
ncbi:hypothetical protein FRZ44_44730 [Hypericibacter terrae]|uniref:Sulfotransferase domain-containing protein n=1 Tax=Hypericibacter terrae TaxID=2602015 RepID=A0A5J6MT07_9PROT|nr:sulfotransferase [Hypericibacter terrae]QEX19160.1 hypothetical protein FRZ44_44730 [Hypericibacter terrae]